MVKTVFLTPGHAVDCTQAEALLADLGKDETVIADKAYDTDTSLDLIETAGAAAVIPSKSCRKSPRPLDRETYKTRNLVERYFGRIKEFRRTKMDENSLRRNPAYRKRNRATTRARHNTSPFLEIQRNLGPHNRFNSSRTDPLYLATEPVCFNGQFRSLPHRILPPI